MAETTTLKHVNVPPAQTWNYLKINELALEVPAAPEHGPAESPEPLLDAIEMGSGPEASAWIRNSAPLRDVCVVPAGGSNTVIVEQNGSN